MSDGLGSSHSSMSISQLVQNIDCGCERSNESRQGENGDSRESHRARREYTPKNRTMKRQVVVEKSVSERSALNRAEDQKEMDERREQCISNMAIVG